MLVELLLFGFFIAQTTAIGCDVKELKTALASGGSINITCSSTIRLDAPLSVTKSVIVSGNGGVVLDGQGKTQLFNIQKGY